MFQVFGHIIKNKHYKSSTADYYVACKKNCNTVHCVFLLKMCGNIYSGEEKAECYSRIIEYLVQIKCQGFWLVFWLRGGLT